MGRVPKESADGDRSGSGQNPADRQIRKLRQGPTRPRGGPHPRPRSDGRPARLRRGHAGLRRDGRPARPAVGTAAGRAAGCLCDLPARRPGLSHGLCIRAAVAAHQPLFRRPPAGAQSTGVEEQRRQLARPARRELAARDPRRRRSARRQGSGSGRPRKGRQRPPGLPGGRPHIAGRRGVPDRPVHPRAGNVLRPPGPCLRPVRRQRHWRGSHEYPLDHPQAGGRQRRRAGRAAGRNRRPGGRPRSRPQGGRRPQAFISISILRFVPIPSAGPRRLRPLGRDLAAERRAGRLLVQGGRRRRRDARIPRPPDAARRRLQGGLPVPAVPGPRPGDAAGTQDRGDARHAGRCDGPRQSGVERGLSPDRRPQRRRVGGAWRGSRPTSRTASASA